MIQKIRTSRISKVVASYLALQMIITIVQPSNLYALTSGPSQPEFNAFTPIGTSDMVNLSTGDFNYNIPIMDVGGYPLNLAYDSGVTMDQEATWVGLGWNLNVGQISRQVRGLPDDFRGDPMTYENDMKESRTVGTTVGLEASVLGIQGLGDLGISAGLGVQYNNYEGVTFHPTYGFSFDIADQVSTGMNISSSTAGGATVSPYVKYSHIVKNSDKVNGSVGHSLGLSMNSRKGLENLSINNSIGYNEQVTNSQGKSRSGNVGNGSGSSFSFNNANNYTPTKRAGMKNSNLSFRASIAGTEIYGLEGQSYIEGFGSFQGMRDDEKYKQVPAYGYNFADYADKENSILDFNREKDRTFNKNTTVLPIANNTFDTYAIQGQGISGQFRPHRGQISYLMDNKVEDHGDGGSIGLEYGLGFNFHTGADIKRNTSYGYTGGWKNSNYAISHFSEGNNDINELPYEKTYYKMIGGLNVDPESSIYENGIKEDAAMKVKMLESTYNGTLAAKYRYKIIDGPNPPLEYNDVAIEGKLKRTQRDKRNTAIRHISNEEAEYNPMVKYNDNEKAKGHHTAGITVLQPDGSTYVYGETAYNWEKKEITVDASGAGNKDCSTGLIEHNGVDAATVQEDNNSDRYKNVITTPAYAHSYLLSSVLSSDYEDITGNGPSPDDLGAYTSFNYGSETNTNYYIPEFNWRTPFPVDGLDDVANYNEGLKSLNNDQKSSIVSGKKELRYIRTIETKTHVAFFRLSDRQDGLDATATVPLSKKIDKIFLFTKPEFDTLDDTVDIETASLDDLSKTAIKTAHFTYDYELCQGIPNNKVGSNNLTDNEIEDQEGKLTLKEVYFTYRASNMGKYTPYLFNYAKDFDNDNINDNNPNYNLKGYDIWGNYKENLGGTNCSISDPLTTSEFPYVDQNQNQDIANQNTGAWTLTSINLPSGGLLEVETESDDYQYVQNRKAMQMFKIHGFGSGNNLPSTNNELYGITGHTDKMYVKLSDETLQAPGGGTYTGNNFYSDYLSENADKPIYFRALLNMEKDTQTKYDFVSGYFTINATGSSVSGSDFTITSNSEGTFVTIPLQRLEKDGGLLPGSGNGVNPISKAGWYFGRTNLNRLVYSLGGDNFNGNFESIVLDLYSSLGAITEIFQGPNDKLQKRHVAKNIILDKSWIRLENPNGKKLGGGLRVSKIQLHDQWDLMEATYTGNPIYKQFYGQEYSYTIGNGTSSGVATYEPNASKENPFVEPFYDDPGNANDKLVAPKESNYAEKPFGESFFPSPSVTYGKVTVQNLERIDGNRVVKKHATGKVVSEFYTSRDFPTKTDFTDITIDYDASSLPSNFLKLSVKNHITMSQGFVIETNDMNGREKSQRVYAEGQDAFISGVDYIYNTSSDNSELFNKVPTINESGNVENLNVGLIYDVFNDFRENYSKSKTSGWNYNVAGFLVFAFPGIFPTAMPHRATHENKLRTSSTTKVIHRSAILKEKIAYDLGSKVSTKNIAWDANTGQVLLTETINEYDDHYYNFTYPSHWYYKGMDRATKNLGIEGYLSKGENGHSYTLNVDEHSGELNTDIFYPGDVILAAHDSEGIGDPHPLESFDPRELWVIKVDSDNVALMDREGVLANDECANDNMKFKIIRSGFRNNQMASMASITSMKNPIDINNDANDTDGDGLIDFNNIENDTYDYISGQGINPYIVNASAVEYKEAWALQWEKNLPKFPASIDQAFDAVSYDGLFTAYASIDPKTYGFNPYLYNARGNWRAKSSYAYLTGRESNTTGSASPRYEGFFTSFNPFYGKNNTNWLINTVNWTSASQVTQYSPFGAELENKDALGRYSSAQYGYNYTLPTAVASNSSYNQIGFDGFEDYEYEQDNNEFSTDNHFGIFNVDDPNTIANATLTDATSHTGRNSLAVTGEISLTHDYEKACGYEPVIPDDSCLEVVGGVDRSGCTFCFAFVVPVAAGGDLREVQASFEFENGPPTGMSFVDANAPSSCQTHIAMIEVMSSSEIEDEIYIVPLGGTQNPTTGIVTHSLIDKTTTFIISAQYLEGQSSSGHHFKLTIWIDGILYSFDSADAPFIVDQDVISPNC